MEANQVPSKFIGSFAFLLVVLALLGVATLNIFLSSGVILWINELIIFTLPIFWFTKNKNVSWKEVCKLNPVSKKVYQLTIIIGLSVYPVFIFLSSIVEVILNSTIGQYYELINFMDATRETNLNFSLFIIGITILAPIFEELFFRGFLQHSLGGYKRKSGWILAGFLFGAVHFANHISNAVGAIFLGLLLSYIAFRTKSILPTIIIHAIVNVLSAILLHIPSFFEYSLSLELLFSPIIVALAITILIITLKQLPPSPNKDTTSDPFRIKAIVPILIALVLLGGIAVSEVNSRLTNLDLKTSSITARQINQALHIITIDIEHDDSNLYLEYYFKAASFDGYLVLQAKNGDEIWTSDPQVGLVLTLQSSETFDHLPANSYDLWLIGNATDLEIEAGWLVMDQVND